MDKRLIETKKTGVCNFDYFCVDSTAKEITINGETIPHGQIAWEVSMLGKEYITELLLLGGYLRQSFLYAEMCSFQIGNYIEVRERILAVLDFIKDTPPFSHFDTQCSREVIEDVFSDEHLKMLEYESQENPNFKLNRWYEVLAVAEGDTMLSHRYARLAAELLNRRRLADEKHKLPWRTMTAWFPQE